MEVVNQLVQVAPHEIVVGDYAAHDPRNRDQMQSRSHAQSIPGVVSVANEEVRDVSASVVRCSARSYVIGTVTFRPYRVSSMA